MIKRDITRYVVPYLKGIKEHHVDTEAGLPVVDVKGITVVVRELTEDYSYWYAVCDYIRYKKGEAYDGDQYTATVQIPFSHARSVSAVKTWMDRTGTSSVDNINGPVPLYVLEQYLGVLSEESVGIEDDRPMLHREITAVPDPVVSG